MPNTPHPKTMRGGQDPHPTPPPIIDPVQQQCIERDNRLTKREQARVQALVSQQLKREQKSKTHSNNDQQQQQHPIPVESQDNHKQAHAAQTEKQPLFLPSARKNVARVEHDTTPITSIRGVDMENITTESTINTMVASYDDNNPHEQQYPTTPPSSKKNPTDKLRDTKSLDINEYPSHNHTSGDDSTSTDDEKSNDEDGEDDDDDDEDGEDDEDEDDDKGDMDDEEEEDTPKKDRKKKRKQKPSGGSRKARREREKELHLKRIHAEHITGAMTATTTTTKAKKTTASKKKATAMADTYNVNFETTNKSRPQQLPLHKITTALQNAQTHTSTQQQSSTILTSHGDNLNQWYDDAQKKIIAMDEVVDILIEHEQRVHFIFRDNTRKVFLFFEIESITLMNGSNIKLTKRITPFNNQKQTQHMFRVGKRL